MKDENKLIENLVGLAMGILLAIAFLALLLGEGNKGLTDLIP